ncbi:HNH endonuclease, partial [Amycolatopsis lurida]
IHNLLKEEPGWTTTPIGNGGMTITTPTGHTYHATPEPLHDPRPEDDTPPF